MFEILTPFIEKLGEIVIDLFEIGLIIGVGAAVVKGVQYLYSQAMGYLGKTKEA